MAKSTALKKIGIVLGSLVGLILVTLIILPFVVDVDKFRPEVVRIVNKKINGTFELGKLELGVWGALRVSTQGIHLRDQKGRDVIQAEKAALKLSWLSLLRASPHLTVAIDSPRIAVVKESNGNLNVSTLNKNPTAPVGETSPKADSGTSHEASPLPSFLMNASFGLEIGDGTLSYKDEIEKSDYKLDDFELQVTNLSLTQASTVHAKMNLSAKGGFQSKGKVKLDFKSQPSSEKIAMEGVLDFSDLEARTETSVLKKSGDKGSFEFQAIADAAKVEVQKGKLHFNSLVLHHQGVVKFAEEPLSFSWKTWGDDVSLNPFIDGKADLALNASGTSTAYAVKIEKFHFTHEKDTLDVKGAVNMTPWPRFEIYANSDSLNASHYVSSDEAPKAGKDKQGKNSGKSSSNASSSSGETNYDAMVKPLRDNPFIREAIGFIEFNCANFSYDPYVLKNLKSRVALNKLKFLIEKFEAQIWKGKIDLKSTIDLAALPPQYQFKGSVRDIDISTASAGFLQSFQKTMDGTMAFEFQGNGASLNPETAKRRMVASGSFKVTNSVFRSIDVGRMVSQALQKAYEKVAEKIPGFKGNPPKSLSNRESKYKSIAATFQLNQGVFVMPDFAALADTNQGFDFKGSTQVRILDDEIQANWEVIDTYDITQSKTWNADIKGISIPHFLNEGNSPLKMPIDVGCKISSPCPKYEKIPEYFLKVALNNTKSSAKTAVQQKVQEKVKAEAKDIGEKLFKGLFKK